MKNLFSTEQDFNDLVQDMNKRPVAFLITHGRFSQSIAERYEGSRDFFVDHEDREDDKILVYRVDQQINRSCDEEGCDERLFFRVMRTRNSLFKDHLGDRFVGLWRCPNSSWLRFWETHSALWNRVSIKDPKEIR
jgi:hypothetical protein